MSSSSYGSIMHRFDTFDFEKMLLYLEIKYVKNGARYDCTHHTAQLRRAVKIARNE